MKKYLIGILVIVCILQVNCTKLDIPIAVISTNLGDIKLELNREAAPITVDNFIEYADSNYYDNTVFHRVIKGFMVQGGGYTPDMKKKSTRETVRNEADNGLQNNRGTIAMARTADPHSATAQFFINTVNNRQLNFHGKNQRGWGYCVFGEVIEGMEVVDAIEAVNTGKKGRMSDVPQNQIIIKSVSVKDTKFLGLF